MIWADKCLSNAVTTLEDLEEEYKELTMKKLQRMVTKVLTNSGVTELVSYLDTGLIKNIQRNTILYISNSLINELSLFESLRGPVRYSGIMSIFNSDQQLRLNNNNKILLKKSLDQWMVSIAQEKHRLKNYIDNSRILMSRDLKNGLYGIYETIKLKIESTQRKGVKVAAKDSISEKNQKDIIFFKDNEKEVIKQIKQNINTVLHQTVSLKIKSINAELSETLRKLKTELRDKCEDWNIVAFIDQVKIREDSFDAESMKKITAYEVYVARPFISSAFGSKLSRERLCINEENFKRSIDAVIKDLMSRFEDNIFSHLFRHTAEFTNYITKECNGILDAIGISIRKFQNDRVNAIKCLELRINSDLKLNACNNILGQIRRKYLDPKNPDY
ncbi:hypothetical protein K7432_008672 [Basidiobolus ranarum]|uniref:Uncharacterized protein n=1 Tax=Basidiobolus ranarum TaxID=34480 RepID=A0ABR2WRH6_9FUNG